MWVANGANDSFAFRCAENGCDVWMGNFRGNGPKKNLSKRPFYDYSVDELGRYDLHAFI